MLKTREISFDPAEGRMNDTRLRRFRGCVARLVRPPGCPAGASAGSDGTPGPTCEASDLAGGPAQPRRRPLYRRRYSESRGSNPLPVRRRSVARRLESAVCLPTRPSSLRHAILADVQWTGTGITRRAELTPMAARPLADRATAALRRRGVGTGLSDLFQGCLLPPIQHVHLYVSVFKSGQGGQLCQEMPPNSPPDHKLPPLI